MWEALKKDGSKVYGEPIMDAFLRVTEVLERSHWEGLPESKKSLVSGQCVLDMAETPEEAKEAMRRGGELIGTAIRAAVVRNDPKMVKFLIDRWDGITDRQHVLQMATSLGHMEVVKVLMAAGVEPGDWALGDAALNGRLDVLRYVVEAKPKADLRYALISAAQGGHVDIMDYLISKGARGLDHALERAAGRGQLDAIKFLIDKGAAGLNDSLLVSVRSLEWAAMDLLLEKGADPSSTIRWAASNMYYQQLDKMMERDKCLAVAERMAKDEQDTARYFMWRREQREMRR